MAESAPPVTDLEARVRELEAENARLTARATPTSAAGGRWRAVVSAICIVLASILVPVSIAGAWARVQLVDEDSFVQTLAPLVDDADVQALVIDEAMSAVRAQVDFDELTGSALDGIAELGLGPRASQALQLLRAPIADGLENLVASTVTTVVESDAFSDIWATTVRGTHRALTLASTSDGAGIVVKTSDGVGIQLGPIVEQVKQRLVDRGIRVASLIPAVDHVVIVGSGETLSLIRTSYALAATMGWWLPVITLALFALGILVSRRRAIAVLGTGIGFALGGAALAVTLAIGATAVATAAGNLGLSPSALDVIYQRLVADMAQTAWVITLLGVLIAVIGGLMGRSVAATGARRAVGSLNDSARRALDDRGLDTGAFGAWLGRNRVLVRVVVAVLAVLWLFALRPLSLTDVLLVVVVALVVGWLLELLQRRPVSGVADEEAPATTDR